MRIAFGNTTSRQYQQQARQGIEQFSQERNRLYKAHLSDRQLLQIVANALKDLEKVITHQNQAIAKLVDATEQQQTALDQFQKRHLL